MTFGSTRSPSLRCVVVRLVLACAWGLLLVSQAHAARVAVVLSEDSAPYQEAYQAIRTQFDATSHDFHPVYAEGLSAAMLGGAHLVVAVGVRAGEAVAALPIRTPVLAAMVPRTWYLKVGKRLLAEGGRRELSAVYVDQPFERQAALIRLALPNVRRVGVLLSTDQAGLVPELESALQANKLTLAAALLPADGRLLATMEGMLPGVDLLLAVADPLVFSRSTAQSLFLTSYRYRTPVLGYSRSMTRAGALLSLHASPAQIGQQTAETAIAALQGTVVRLPPPAYPVYFSLSTNDKVGRSLGIPLAPEAELATRMGARP